MDFEKYLKQELHITTMQPQDKVVEYVALDDIVRLLKYDDELRFAIFRNVERELRREDFENYCEDAEITIDDETLEKCLDDFDDLTNDSDEWIYNIENALRCNGIDV